MIRPYDLQDDVCLSSMLTQEGIAPDKMRHRDHPTWCAEENGEVVGFYTVRLSEPAPYLQHFCVKAGSRYGRVSRELMQHLKLFLDYRPFTVHVKKGKDKLKRGVEAYFRAKPYAETEDRFWYFVGVSR